MAPPELLAGSLRLEAHLEGDAAKDERQHHCIAGMYRGDAQGSRLCVSSLLLTSANDARPNAGRHLARLCLPRLRRAGLALAFDANHAVEPDQQ